MARASVSSRLDELERRIAQAEQAAHRAVMLLEHYDDGYRESWADPAVLLSQADVDRLIASGQEVRILECGHWHKG